MDFLKADIAAFFVATLLWLIFGTNFLFLMMGIFGMFVILNLSERGVRRTIERRRKS